MRALGTRRTAPNADFTSSLTHWRQRWMVARLDLVHLHAVAVAVALAVLRVTNGFSKPLGTGRSGACIDGHECVVPSYMHYNLCFAYVPDNQVRFHKRNLSCLSFHHAQLDVEEPMWLGER